MKVVIWGTYDTGKPRVRILIRGLRERGLEVTECHHAVWGEIADKSQVKNWSARLGVLLRWAFAYPALVLRYLRLPRHDVVVCAYLGQVDLLVLWPFARLRGAHVAWDAFLSLYNTVVEDRRLVGPRHPLAWLLYALEWLDCRAADTVFTDTHAHGQYFQQRFGFPPARLIRVLVGVEPERFPPSSAREKCEGRPFTVLFYGQFIALHGIEVIVRAAKSTEGEDIVWQLVGKGQEASRIRALVDELSPANLDWKEWVPYEDLVDRIHNADVCLGIFGDTDKARRVIPNKVYQVVSAGCALITGDSSAIRELVQPGLGIRLVPMGDYLALADAVREMARTSCEGQAQDYDRLRERIAPSAVVDELVEHLKRHASASG